MQFIRTKINLPRAKVTLVEFDYPV